MAILNMVNNSRTTKIYDTNFRTSCHKLSEHGYIDKYRNHKSLKLAWRLTEIGRKKAKGIFKKRMEKLNL